jgi:elongation factor P
MRLKIEDCRLKIVDFIEDSHSARNLQSAILNLQSHYLRDVHPVNAAAGGFRDRDREKTLFEIRRDPFHVDGFRQCEGTREPAVPALDAMVLLAGHFVSGGPAGARTANHDTVVFGVDLDLIACESRKFRGEDELGGRFVQVDRWRPAGRVSPDKLPDLLVQREQIAQRIPTREGHARIVARFWDARTLCATIARIYGRRRSVHEGPGTATDMSSIQATRLRKGMLIKLGNDLFRILDLHHLTPGNKRAHIQARLRNIRTLALADEKFRAEEDIERATLDELAPTVDLVVKETVPGIKGATASAQVKPATVETGLVVQVPPFVNTGDMIRVNTETGEYLSRA